MGLSVITGDSEQMRARVAAIVEGSQLGGARHETRGSLTQRGVTRPPISGKRSYARRSASRCAGLSSWPLASTSN